MFIFADQKSGGTHDVSIWRATECCSLGDTAVGGYYKFAAFMVKDVTTSQNALAKPTGYGKIYSNERSKANRVTIWRPNCPPDYVALGYVASPNDNPPSAETTNFRCVLEAIASKNTKWTWIYNDVNSGSRQDGEFWRAEPATIRGDSVGVWAMSAVAKYTGMDTAALVLKAANVSVRFQKPIKSMKIRNALYDFDNKEIVSQGPSDITSGQRATAQNCGESIDCLLSFLVHKNIV
jgi:hypothetical protein